MGEVQLEENSRSFKTENRVRKPCRLCWSDGIGPDIYLNTSWVRISQGDQVRPAL